ncbi:MAG: anti-sigma factor [Gammaproteobacteria bacterium]|nr:anti-sigma factor [Gammaproteobacteria bacterium]
MTYKTPVTESDLHAYIDGELSPDRQREVERYLQDNPEAAKKVAHYQTINQQLGQLYDPILEEPLPAQLQIRKQLPSRWMRVAAVAAWMSFGGLIGWQLHDGNLGIIAQADALEREHLVKPAAFAHKVFSAEVRHPVEVGADQQEHLVAWLSNRMKTEIRAPSLADQGYTLMGGRLLPSTNRMAAQFMYQHQNGERVTLYIRKGEWDAEETALRFAEQDGTGVSYWINGPMAYSIVGQLEQNKLLALSETVYPQLSNY